MKALPKLFTDKILYDTNGAGCWIWFASRDRKGYGQFGWETKVVRAHRFAYQTLVGPIPEGLVLDHLCRNRACCNPSHLEPVTNKVNVRRGAGNFQKTHCPSGHPYNEANTRHYKSERRCRICRKLRDRTRRSVVQD